ncbi:MAG TPA: histidine kinase [Beutenbergiaceae bacterium]|nr:histidine kinase [Beutenbergiaceae bacterium]
MTGDTEVVTTVMGRRKESTFTVVSMESTRDAPLLGKLLPALQVLSLICLLFAAVTIMAGSGPWSDVAGMVAVVYLAAIPVAAALWFARARQRSGRGRAVLSTAAGVALLPVALSGAVGFTIPALLLAVALIVVDSGKQAGFIAAGIVAVAGTLLHLNVGNGLVVGLANALPVMVLLCFGIALGAALRAYQQAHARDQQTITERDEALAQLQEAITRLRRTNEIEKELLLADERARSARDLHDGLGHRLTLISMGLEFARRTRESDPEAAWSEVANADATAREALTEMRTWVRALSPVRDPEATGVAAFEAIAESFRGSGLQVTVDTGGHEHLPLTQEASLLMYRTVQEGLTNALRHGRAQRVQITLASGDGDLVLRIVNDLDERARAALPAGEIAAGFGLRGLADRAAAVGGTARAEHKDEHVELTVRVDRKLAIQPGELSAELRA